MESMSSEFCWNVSAPGEAWRFLQGESPCYTKSNQQHKPSVAHMKERIKAAGGDARELVNIWRPWRGRRTSRQNDMCEAYTGTMQAAGGFASPRELIQPRKKSKQSAMRLTWQKPERRVREGENHERLPGSLKTVACKEGSDMNLGGPASFLERGRRSQQKRRRADGRRGVRSVIVLGDGKADHKTARTVMGKERTE